ncbi:uncharacterized protein BP5553_08371 [Venustampulla echinocandica]|uniref:Myb-like domain-containing protein n=1 Tax=Venustampulla echinocandica TaxID=2656787 RepID=A0A370TGI7_9HELO|nr:uncharacterized protein BP5553_08371 [Venustampulla echinocandica]RDL34003.1 hypothetical protein BP5553_08371 [Venustampulla echinocandica]
MSAEFTSKDALFFQLILMNMTNMPKVNWVLIAERAGYNNAKVAQTRFGQIKKKITTAAAANENQNSAPSTPTVSPRKRKAASSEDDEMPEKMKSIGRRSGKARKKSAYENAIAALQNDEPDGSLEARDSDGEFLDVKREVDYEV